jgi:hypothetical protein
MGGDYRLSHMYAKSNGNYRLSHMYAKSNGIPAQVYARGWVGGARRLNWPEAFSRA